jgi:hypothetical protein
VDEGNVDDINEIIGNLPTGDKDTLDEIQSVVDAYNALLDTVDDPNTTPNLDQAGYKALGFPEVDTPDEVNAVNAALRTVTTQDIKPYAKLSALVAAILATDANSGSGAGTSSATGSNGAQPIPTLSPVALWAMVALLLALGLMGQGQHSTLRRSSSR